MANESKVVDVKSAWVSKINWTQAIAVAAAALSFLGFNLDAQTQAQFLAAIVAIQGIVTWFLRTFKTKTITPTAAEKM